MEALLQSLAMKYGMDKAVQLLGIDKQQANPKYAISLGGQSINPMNMLKRAGLNQGMKGIMSGGKMSGMLGPGLLLGGALGIGYLTNPLREGSYNYNPELQGQIDYASGKGYIGRNPSSGLMQYGPESVLSGQNVVSMFGTNDYGKQLQKYRDKYADTMPKERLEKLDREIQDQITDDFDKTDEFMETIKQKTPVYTPSPGDNDGGGSGFDTSKSGSEGAFGSYDGSKGRKDYRRGGIASL